LTARAVSEAISKAINIAISEAINKAISEVISQMDGKGEMLKMMQQRKFNAEKNERKGFTLIEVIVVIVIIAILAAIAVPSLTRYISSAEQKQVQSIAHNIQVVLQAEMTEKYEKKFDDGDGTTLAYTGGDTYAKILADNGVALAATDTLTGIKWNGRVLAEFKYSTTKYSIEYTNTTGFKPVVTL